MKLCKLPKKSKEQIYKSYAEKQNKAQSGKFASVPFEKRLVFVPHCMRNSSVCKASEKDSFYICARCGACKIGDMARLAKELGYGGFYILKGGRAIIKIIGEQKPLAVLGVACFFEGSEAFKLTRDLNIAVQFVPLTKDGCASTDADLTEFEIKLGLSKKL